MDKIKPVWTLYEFEIGMKLCIYSGENSFKDKGKHDFHFSLLVDDDDDGSNLIHPGIIYRGITALF